MPTPDPQVSNSKMKNSVILYELYSSENWDESNDKAQLTLA